MLLQLADETAGQVSALTIRLYLRRSMNLTWTACMHVENRQYSTAILKMPKNGKNQSHEKFENYFALCTIYFDHSESTFHTLHVLCIKCTLALSLLTRTSFARGLFSRFVLHFTPLRAEQSRFIAGSA